MKKVLSIISSVSIFASFTTGVWVYESKPASAYYVHNLIQHDCPDKNHDCLMSVSKQITQD